MPKWKKLIDNDMTCALRATESSRVMLADALTHAELLSCVLSSAIADRLLLTPVFVAIVEAKWQLMRPLWQAELALHLLLCGTYTALAVCTARHEGIGAEPSPVALRALGVAVVALCLPFPVLEVLNIVTNKRFEKEVIRSATPWPRFIANHFSSAVNACDGLCHSLVIYVGASAAAGPAALANPDAIGLAAALLGLRVITYLRAIECVSSCSKNDANDSARRTQRRPLAFSPRRRNSSAVGGM